jgi:HSP20 family protein
MVMLNEVPMVFRNGSVESEIDQLLDDTLQSMKEWSQEWEPACNTFEDEQGFTIQMALPGMEADQIDLWVENNVLRVKGQRSHGVATGTTWYERGIPEGAFSCSFRLPAFVDHDKSTASYRQGLLTINFPKRDEAKPRRIAIECS